MTTVCNCICYLRYSLINKNVSYLDTKDLNPLKNLCRY